MEKIEIKEVAARKELKKFVDFPFALYKGNAYWCPPLKFEERNRLRKDKNPAFDYCEAQYWMAYQNGKPAGRIAGIINHQEVDCWDVKRVRFGWIDFIDDIEVTTRLMEMVIEWGKRKGMTSIHGPLGFTNMDAAGMLIEGFDEISTMSTIYNYPYYAEHMQELGLRKAADWIQYEIRIPDEIPEKVDRMTRIVFQKYDLRLLKPRNTKEMLPYAKKMFDLYNAAFHEIYGFTPLTRKQVDYYTTYYLGFLQPKFVVLVIDAKDDVVGFCITIPSLCKALQKANGTLFPFGFLYLRQSLRRNDTIVMCLVGVRPDYQNKGLLALIYNELNKTYLKEGITTGLIHPQLEENLKAISIWKNYNVRLNIRRRCWMRDI